MIIRLGKKHAIFLEKINYKKNASRYKYLERVDERFLSLSLWYFDFAILCLTISTIIHEKGLLLIMKK